MFETLRGKEIKDFNVHSGRSHFGETMQLEGDIRSSGAVDVAGLINGNVYVSEVTVTDTGSVRGMIEAKTIEINGHIEGKITADSVIVGKNAVIKGDIFFKDTLKTEEGADIDGYIKRINTGKANSEEDIAIEEIVEREVSGSIKPKSGSIKPKIVPVTHHKEAV
jgi:cytoskeletal protein CcmA (bactofilin family)|tara:strand:- start:1389 stop:1883 length:495 start_codon:yes stop_codon:yes gene_type:complete